MSDPNRSMPAGTEDYAGDDYMDKAKAEVDAQWDFASVPLDDVAGTNTITAAARVTLSAGYVDGMGFVLRPANDTTGAATLNVDSQGAKDILDYKGDALKAGALKATGGYELRFFDADDAFRVMTGPAGFANVESAAVIAASQQSNGTAGGGATSGSWQDYPLNTAVKNDLSGEGAGVSASVVTLPAGTYDFVAAAPFHQTGNTRLRLYNSTDGAVIAAAAVTVRATTANEIKCALLFGRFTLAATKSLKLQYRCSATKATDGLGQAASFSETEQYGVLSFFRPAEGGADGADAAPRYDIVAWDTDRPASGEELLKAFIATAVTFPIHLSTSYASVEVAPTADAVFSIRKNGTEFGTLTFASGVTAGAFASSANAVFAAGDILSVIAPDPRDDTLSGLALTISGTR